MWASLQYLRDASAEAISTALTYFQGARAAPTETVQVDPDTGAVSVVPPTIKPLVRGTAGRNRIITPYRADAFERRLRKLNLVENHVGLLGHLRDGFPVGDFQPLEKTYTPSNHATQAEQLDLIQEYIDGEVSLGRMDGPYDKDTVKRMLESEFMTSPSFVIEDLKSRSPEQFRPVQDYLHKNRDGFSVNGSAVFDEFCIEWHGAAWMTQTVSCSALRPFI